MTSPMRIRTVNGLGILCLATSLFAQPPEPLTDEARLASQELEVAKSKGFYYVMDIPGRALTLKLRGVTLRSYPLQTVELGEPLGGPADPDWAQGVCRFRKETESPPRQIEPGGSSLENPLLSDDGPAPPTSFMMSCDSGLSIRIRTASHGGFWSSLADRWVLDNPTRSVRLRVLMADEDAQRLYRSLPDEAVILFKPVG